MMAMIASSATTRTQDNLVRLPGDNAAVSGRCDRPPRGYQG